MPAYPDDNKENKKSKLNEGAVSGLSQFFFKKKDPNRPPPLTGGNDNNNDPLMEAQNKEVRENSSVAI
jgi:hypothetical protein